MGLMAKRHDEADEVIKREREQSQAVMSTIVADGNRWRLLAVVDGGSV